MRLDNFLHRFFGDGNEIDPVKHRDRLQPWIERLVCDPPRPSVLPRIYDGLYSAYALAFDGPDSAEWANLLKAFFGPTWSRFRGTRQPLQIGDPVERAVSEFTGGRGFRVEFGPVTDNSLAVRQTFKLLLACTRQRPMTTRALQKPIARLLEEFYWALEARNDIEAEESLAAIEASRQLSSLNRCFLQIRRLAAFRRWEEVVHHKNRNDILALHHRPSVVTEDFLEGYFWTRIARDGVLPRGQAALEDWKPLADGLAGHLAEVFVEPARPTSALCILLNAIHQSQPERHVLAERLMGLIPQGSPFEPLYQDLAEQCPRPEAPPKASSLELVQQLLDSGASPQSVLLMAPILPSTANSLELLVEAAVPIDSPIVPDALQVLVEFRQRLSEQESRAFDSTIAAATLHGLERLAGEAREAVSTASSWADWLTQLAAADEARSKQLLRMARERFPHWPVEDSQDQFRSAFSEATRSTVAVNVLPKVLPHLLEALDQAGAWGHGDLRDVAGDLLEVLLLDMLEEASDSQFDTVSSLLEAAGREGFSGRRLDDVLRLLTELFQTRLSCRRLEPAGHIMETLLEILPDPSAALTGLGAALQQLYSSCGRHLDPTVRRVHQLVISDLGWPDPFPSTVDGTAHAADSLAALAGKTIGIYTLNESVGRRVESIIAERTGGRARVQLNHALVSTERLETMVRGSDYLLVAWNCATHAATRAFDNRNRATPLLWVKGKGSTAMIRELEEYLLKAS